MNRLTSKIIFRGEAINKFGVAPLAVQAFVNGEKAVLGLNILIPPVNWCKETESIIFSKDSPLSKPDIIRYNDLLKKAKSKIIEIRHHYDMIDIYMSALVFKQEFSSETRKHSFFDFANASIKFSLDKKILEPSTAQSHYQTINKLQEFKQGIKFGDLKPELLKEFGANLKKRGLSANTISKHHKNFKTLINLAIEKNVRIKNPYDDFKIIRIQGEREILNEVELMSLRILYRSNTLSSPLKKVLQAFLFACFTGLRISDILLFKHTWIQDNMICFVQHKTRNQVPFIMKVPIPSVAHEYLPEDIGMKLVYELPTGQKINEHLKTLMRLIDSKKIISFHCARHTFATRFLRRGGRIEVLQKILGHAKIETTMIYVHICEDEKEMQMKLMDDNALETVSLTAFSNSNVVVNLIN